MKTITLEVQVVEEIDGEPGEVSELTLTVDVEAFKENTRKAALQLVSQLIGQVIGISKNMRITEIDVNVEI